MYIVWFVYGTVEAESCRTEILFYLRKVVQSYVVDFNYCHKRLIFNLQ